jgi:hypothetical protein
VLTDLRLVSLDGREGHELALQDIEDVQLVRTRVDRACGAWTIVARARRRHGGSLTLRRVRRGRQLAALLELLANDPSAAPDPATVNAVLGWSPPTGTGRAYRLAAAAGAAVAVVSTIVIGLHGESPRIDYPENDAIRPGGVKRDREAIVAFMETEVLPWAQATIGPLKGGASRVGCETCHGAEPDAREWAMPSVAALPEPHVQEYGSEALGPIVDAQMRNAMYGYLAESDKQTRAAYMRQVVVPGIARLLGRPVYDFTKTYEYNRTRYAIGCYHCHVVGDGPSVVEKLRN